MGAYYTIETKNKLIFPGIDTYSTLESISLLNMSTSPLEYDPQLMRGMQKFCSTSAANSDCHWISGKEMTTQEFQFPATLAPFGTNTQPGRWRAGQAAHLFWVTCPDSAISPPTLVEYWI